MNRSSRPAPQPPGFTLSTTAVDARVVAQDESFLPDRDDDEARSPKRYRFATQDHELDVAEKFTSPSRHEIQERCRRMEQLETSCDERHTPCQDQEGELTEEACQLCEQGAAG